MAENAKNIEKNRIVRKKYCIIKSCENNKGTCEKIRMFSIITDPNNSRFPKNERLAKQWNLASGFDSEEKMSGLICSKHFKDEDMKKKGHDIQLVLGAIPFLDLNKSEGSNTNDTDNANFMNPMSLMSHVLAVNECQRQQKCDECTLKDVLIKQYESEIESLQNQLLKVRKSTYYLKSSKSNLKETLNDEKHKNVIDSQLLKELEELKSNEILCVLLLGIERFKKYSPMVRRFCLSLHYHSPRAYEFIRKTFNNNLPTVKTIQSWYSKSDLKAEPGIQPDHINRLKKMATDIKEKHATDIICSLVFDEVNIRQQVYWSKEQSKYVGLVEAVEDYDHVPKDGNNEHKIQVKQIIVFFLNGININFQHPVAYYTIDNLNAAQRKEILLKIITAVTVECNIRISNVTFDGLACNAKMCNMLGANLDVDSPGFQPFFHNPINGEKICVIFDPCHMEKIIRNTLANKQVMHNGSGGRIEWKYFEQLHELSKETSLATHKLTTKHIQWKSNPQSVHLATQTLSNSTANTMQFLMQQNIPEFISAGATIEFIQIVDRLFDIFNSKYSHMNSENIFKRPLHSGNARIIFNFFETTIEYLKSLKIPVDHFTKNKKTNSVVHTTKIKPILKTRNFTAFRGSIVNMHSLKLMFTEFVQKENIMTEISTYYILQDVIEMFFGKIRSCCGYNNNPNIDQFKGAYRKLLGNLEIITSNFANCRATEALDSDLPENPFYSNIYFISSKRATTVLDDIKKNYEQQKDEILMEVAKLNEIRTNYSLLDVTSNFSIAYIASLIERKIIKSPRFYCSRCQSVFEENEKYNAIDGNVLKSLPCTSTYKICENAESFFKLYDIKQSVKQFDFRVVYCLIFRTMNLEQMFMGSSFSCDSSHKYQFIKCIVGEYIDMRATQLSKRFTLEKYGNILRQHLNRLVIYKGQ